MGRVRVVLRGRFAPVGVTSVLIGGLAGAVLGLVTASFRESPDRILQQFVDGVMAIPSLVLSLVAKDGGVNPARDERPGGMLRLALMPVTSGWLPRLVMR